jgi:dTDP-4-amino-4,6-dideoxygalactose transaminase
MGDDRMIPFNQPRLVGQELEYMRQAIDQGCLSGDGAFTKKCHALLERTFDVPKVLLTTSCTHALEMTALLLDIQPGDEVIIPSFTFVSTINAFILRSAKPVFADIRPDTLNLDETRLAALVTPRTKAIVPVHYAGVGCEMDTIIKIANHFEIAVIEDNAQGLFGKYKDRYLGTFGHMATQSFHDTKNITCGEGGALLINDPTYIERAEILREKGTNRSRFYQGLVDKYTWVDVGSSYLPSELLAAFLYAQLEQSATVQAARKRIWEYYYTHLADWALAHDVGLPFVPVYCEQPYHLFYMLMPTPDQRQAMIHHLKSQGIQSVFHYLPLHTSAAGQRFGGRLGACPVTESVSERLLRLPLYYALTDANQARVVEAVRSFYETSNP